MIHLKGRGCSEAGRRLGRAGAWGQRASPPVGFTRRQQLTFLVSFSASTPLSTADAQFGKKAGYSSGLQNT